MKEKISRFVSREKWLLIFVAVIAVFAYGYMVFNFALTGDEERDLVLGTRFTSKFELPLGRYGQWLFRLIFMEGMMLTPGYGDLLAVLFLAASAVVWCANFELIYREEVATVSKCIFSGIYMTVPYASAGVMCYTFLNASSMLAVLCVSLAMRCIILSFTGDKKKRILYLIAALLLETHALATYQAHASDIILGSVICVFVGIYSDRDLKIKDLLFKVLRYAGVFVAAFIVYEIISHIIGLSEYTDNFIMWGTDSFGALIRKLWASISAIYDSDKTVGGVYLFITVIVFYCSVILNLIINKNIRGRMKIVYAVISVLVPPAAYAVSIALGGMTHYATHTAVLLMAGFMWFHVVSTLRKKYLYQALIVFACFIMIRQIDLDNRIYYGARLVSELDMELGYAIGTEIYRVADTTNVTKPVAIVGKYRHNAPNVIEIGMEGRSIFLRKNIYKLYLLKYLGFKFVEPTAEQLTEAEEIAKDMPLWPLDGSVVETEDLIIVHLSLFH